MKLFEKNIIFRRAEIMSNRLEVPDEQTLEQSPVDQTYFTVREQSLHGDCQTIYNIHPLPVYEAMEIEEQLETAEKTQKEYEHQGSELSQGRLLCQGKKYWQITKTRDFDNCIERPVFQKWYGLRSQCDTTKANCRDLMTVSIFGRNMYQLCTCEKTTLEANHS